jgi:hypothetical protein
LSESRVRYVALAHMWRRAQQPLALWGLANLYAT